MKAFLSFIIVLVALSVRAVAPTYVGNIAGDLTTSSNVNLTFALTNNGVGPIDNDVVPLFGMNPWDQLPTNYTEDQWLNWVTNMTMVKWTGVEWVALGENSYWLDANYWPQSTNFTHGVKYMVDVAHALGFKVLFGFSVYHGLPNPLASHSSHPDTDAGWQHCAVWAVTNGFDRVSTDSISLGNGGERLDVFNRESKLFAGYLRAEAALRGLACPSYENNLQHNTPGLYPDTSGFAASWGLPNLIGTGVNVAAQQDYHPLKDIEFQIVTNILDPILTSSAYGGKAFHSKPFFNIGPGTSDAPGMLTNEFKLMRNALLTAVTHSSLEPNEQFIFPGWSNKFLLNMLNDPMQAKAQVIHYPPADTAGWQIIRTRMSGDRMGVVVLNRTYTPLSVSLPITNLFTGPTAEIFDINQRTSLGSGDILSCTLPGTAAQGWIITPLNNDAALNVGGTILSRAYTIDTNQFDVTGSVLDTAVNGHYIWDGVALEYSNTTSSTRWCTWGTNAANVLAQWYFTAAAGNSTIANSPVGLLKPALDYRDIRKLVQAGTNAGWAWSNGTAMINFTMTMPTTVSNNTEAATQRGLPVLLGNKNNLIYGNFVGLSYFPWSTTNLPGYAGTTKLWYRPNISGFITNGGTLIAATDLTGNGNHGQNAAAQSTWPTAGTTTAGYKTIKCDGSTRYFGSSTFTNDSTSTSDTEWHFLFKWNDTTNGNIRILMDSWNTASRMVIGQNGGSGSAGQMQMFVSGGAGQFQGFNFQTNAWLYMAVVFSGAASSMWSNALSAVSGSIDYGGQNGCIFGDYGGHGGFCAPAEFADIACFKPALNAAQRLARFQEVVNYFQVAPFPVALVANSTTSFTNVFGMPIQVAASGQTTASMTLNGNTWMNTIGTSPSTAILYPNDWLAFTCTGTPVGMWRYLP